MTETFFDCPHSFLIHFSFFFFFKIIQINFIAQKILFLHSTNDFTTVINLPPGTHKLKFIVDDEWKCSNDLSTATDPDGNLVNYLEVYEDDDCNSIEKESLGSEGTRSKIF